jgi:hypothetical protein
VQCTVLKVTPLLRELILRAVRIGNSYGPEGAEWWVMQVLLLSEHLERALPDNGSA